jgi:hypothetical protein
MLKIRVFVRLCLLFAISILSGLIIVEFGLRVLGISYIQAYTYDESRGNALRPKAKGRWSSEGRSYIRISRAGLRDREYPLNKGKNTFRIVILGDSFAEAFQVTHEKTFWSIMEHELNSCSVFNGKNVEVINFGVSGYGTAQELLTFREHAKKYNPDLVLLAVLTGNDIRNNSKALEPDKVRPFYVYKDGKLELDLSFRQLDQYKKGQSLMKRFMREASSYSHIVQLLYEVKQRGPLASLFANRTSPKESSKQKPESEQKTDRNRKQPIRERGLDVQVYHPTSTQDWEMAWNITEGLIVMMSDEVEKMGAGFLVVTLSDGIQVHPDPSVRRAFMDGAGINNLFYPDERIRKVCTDAGISVLTLAPLFQAYAEKNEVCLHGFTNGTMCGGHWNEEGHLYAGRLIADEICKTGSEHTR